uniref:Solute carrier family 28 member 3 n=1 Tax=Gopherus evgoodei TaxID=1825980 RepID=A0A8C4YIV9_9SAUR
PLTSAGPSSLSLSLLEILPALLLASSLQNSLNPITGHYPNSVSTFDNCLHHITAYFWHQACNLNEHLLVLFLMKLTGVTDIHMLVSLTAYLMIVIAACVLNFQRALALFVLTVLAIFFICWDFLIARYEDKIAEFFSPCERFLKQQWFCDFCIFIFLTKAGFDVFNWLGRQIQLLNFVTVVSMLYHVGFMQWLIKKVGWIMQVTLGTTPVESLVAAGNIFVGHTESPLLVRPYLPYVTKSELHSIMTSGFSTIAGSVLGAYISFGVSASHLLTASVMSAPASLAISKLFWPETKISQITLKSGIKMEKGDSKNLLEAASQGASASIPLVANIAVNLIAFLALLSFVDSSLSWLGNMFNYPQLNFEIICAYVFMPFSFMMGVDWEDSFIVGGLLGYKTFFNEFVAYERLSMLIHLREKGGPVYIGGVKQYMTVSNILYYVLAAMPSWAVSMSVLTSQTRSGLVTSRIKELQGKPSVPQEVALETKVLSLLGICPTLVQNGQAQM